MPTADKPKKDGYFVLRDPGGTLHDISQGKTLHGKVPAHVRLTPMIRKALGAKAIVEISKSEFNTRLKELGMETREDGTVAVKLDKLTDIQQGILDQALELEVIVKKNGAFLMDKEKIATGEGGLVKKLKERKFLGKLKKEIEIANVRLDGSEDTNEDNTEDKGNDTGSKVGDKGKASENTEVKDHAVILLECVDKEVITQNEGTYMFGEFALGANDEEAIAFLQDAANEDILAVLEKELKGKGTE